MKKVLTLLVVCCFYGAGSSTADAVELLSNGNLELINLPPSWSLVETVTDMPGRSVNAGEIEGFANQPNPAANQAGLWLRAFAGNQNGLMNQKINAILSQTVPGAAGENYTFSGWSLWEQNYSGGVDFLDPLSPSMGGPSPTETTMKLEFLDSGGSTIGTPVSLDVKSNRVAQSPIFFANDNAWYQHTLMGTAPAGTANVRVTASGTDMIINIDPGQSAFYDNFSLKAASAPATEKLANANLNAPEFTPNWTLIKSPANATTGTFNTEGFANNTPDGLGGFWLRAFINGDAKITQTVPGMAGGDYTFAAMAKLEANYSAADTFMELAFLDASQTVIGTPVLLDIIDDGQPLDGTWHPRDVSADAPLGTAFVRVTAGATGMSVTPGTPSASGFFDDFSLMLAPAGLTGDYNNDGTVDAADYVVWRKTGINGPQGYDDWRANFGAMAPGSGSGLTTGAVPEPAGCILAAIALLGSAGMRYRRCESH
ncbi:MAG: hypothetical protein WD738_14805 [Pirellulales bacterium]